MRRNFIVDQEIKLLDGSDFLNTKVYADTLQKMIKNAPHQKPFTIGLFGEWGSGKSSIIKTAKENLQDEKTFKAKFAVFDAWKYSEDAFRRSFILSLSKELNIVLPKQEYNLYENQTQRINDFKIKIPIWTWIILGLVLIILSLLYLLVPWFKTHVISLLSLISLYLISSTIFLSLKAVINKDLVVKALSFIQSLVFTKYDEERPLLFSPEQFSRAFEHIVDKATSEIDRLVIVIDNIDRCEKNYSTELLSTIKGFLESREKVLFILPVDETSLKRHIRETHKADDKEADEFLRKFFNATLRIKPYHPSEIYVFAKQVNDKFNLSFSDYTLDLVSKEYASNPRRIIQMFNNLSAELECFTDDSFVKTNETIICKLLILREEFPKYYYYLSKNPYLMEMSTDEMKAHFNNIGGQDLVKAIWNQGLENFLNKTKIITESSSTKELNQILSNSIVFSDLPIEIENYIENLQYEEVKKFISNDAKKKVIVIDYLIQQLDVYKERKLIGNSFINSLNMLIELNMSLTLSKTVNMRIEEIIKPILHGIYNAVTDLAKLVTYSWSLMPQQRSYLVDSLIEHINQELIPEKFSPKWGSALSMAVNIYTDKKILKKLNQSFKNAYEEDSKIFDIEKFKPVQIVSLIDDDLYSSIIKRITVVNQADTFYNHLHFVLLHSTPTLSVGNEIITKINELNPPPLNKNHQEYTELLTGINGLLNIIKIDFSSNTEQLQTLGDTVWADKRTPHASYPNQSQYDTVIDFISDYIRNQDNINELLNFCFNVYRLTLNEVDIIPVLKKISATDTYKEAINLRLIELMEQGINLSPLYDLVFSDTIYSTNALILVKNAFLLKQAEAYIVDDSIVKGKLNEIVNLININDNRNATLTAFLEGIISDNRSKDLLTEMIPVQTKENILKLSKPLQSLAIDKILDTDKIFDFSDNIDFLKVIAETGDKKHISQLVKDILIKLQHGDQFDNAISIIKDLKNISNTDSKRIVRELESHMGDLTKEDILKDTIDRLKKINDN